MASILSSGMVDKKPQSKLSGEVEYDEVYVAAGHQGNPSAVKKKRRLGRRNRLRGAWRW
ncbi:MULTISPECIES: hypothetical protein [Legionella]|uniref:Uncharacterized protein n=1 Tax=Legionella steelei TaxID=947033 RepID=A0A0W0ZFN5_9GAMM|nr:MULTISPECIES: hypothetical protein [Legionella]KTD67694.1 hypothetical protein Lste_0852 [Legionella steelei]MBN9228466.1 hypothetical protein [Legionella steelei]